jgi:hypothetical protein
MLPIQYMFPGKWPLMLLCLVVKSFLGFVRFGLRAARLYLHCSARESTFGSVLEDHREMSTLPPDAEVERETESVTVCQSIFAVNMAYKLEEKPLLMNPLNLVPLLALLLAK